MIKYLFERVVVLQFQICLTQTPASNGLLIIDTVTSASSLKLCKEKEKTCNSIDAAVFDVIPGVEHIQ